MGLKTPFFSAFGPLLFGRRAHRPAPEVEEDLGQLRGLFWGLLCGSGRYDTALWPEGPPRERVALAKAVQILGTLSGFRAV